MSAKITPTGNELFFNRDEIIVSKTDVKGRITYANDIFIRLSGFSEEKLLGTPHSVIRHPDMPRCIFKLLWDTLQAGEEIFAYVVNMSKNGDHYWVLAHVTPTFDKDGQITSYHSNRRIPQRDVLENTIIPLYKSLIEIEQGYKNRKEGMKASYNKLISILEDKGVGYDEFVFSLCNPPENKKG